MVEHFELKSRRVRVLSCEGAVISITKLREQQMQIRALNGRRCALLTFGLVYHTPPELLARVPQELERIVDQQPLATFDRCHAMMLAPSSIDFELVFFVETAEVVEFMATRQALMLAMLRRFDELEIAFAYPTQTTFTAAPDGTLVTPYAATASNAK